MLVTGKLRYAVSIAGIEALSGCDQTVLEAGEAVTIVTSTGGGFGET
jgi:5-oxoprolinase (ATP-hydrolysing)